MRFTEKPRFDLAKQMLPKGLFEALSLLFSNKLQGCALVGGTALAGFYAAHRKSDDLDLFTESAVSQKATVLAVESLQEKGVVLSDVFRTAQYFRAIAVYLKHNFTIDIVQDSNLFRVGKFYTLEKNICVADLKTLLKTKSATLVSRCSEKDLFDLLWIFEHLEEDLNIPDIIEYGKEIDLGLNGESLLISLGGAILNKSACGFTGEEASEKDKVFSRITAFQKELIKGISQWLHDPKSPQTDTTVTLKQIAKRISKLVN